jgi:cytochrome c
MIRTINTAMVILLAAAIFSCQSQQSAPKILVFSKTEGYRHASIETGQQAIMDMGEREGFSVDTTENADKFIEENLKQYAAVVFLNTTLDVLNYQQQSYFERYIQAGGGFVGIHAAADTEYDWPWYGKLVGAYFESHPSDPNVLDGTCQVIDHNHQATDSLAASFEKRDEFYNYKNINPDLNVLITLDESTYEGGTNGDFHPITWYHEYDGGRAFYTGFGHTKESFSEPEFLEILSGGIQYAIGENQPLDYSLARYEPMPDENRFSKTVLDYNLYEPLELEVLPNGDVLFIERRGALKMYKPDLDSTLVIHEFEVYLGIGRNGRHEDGLLGLALDPNYEENHWIYLYYSPPGDEEVQNLSRFSFDGTNIQLDSEIVMLKVGVQRQECCHTGGSIQFGPNGNLFLSTGDDTNPFASDGFSPSDERPNRGPWDAQKGPSNTNDLRGKILRITPQPDGSYTIPEGNLFPPGTPNTRPEIYVMGCRNPYRIGIDFKTGYLYWGDVGPDARADDPVRGPRGIDEFNQAREAGFFGWPYFTGNNLAYAEHDFASNTTGSFHDPKAPINNSPNNTGLENLPPAKEAFIYYGYAESEEWPILGAGGKNAMAGPVYYGENYPDSPNKYPKYFDGKILFYEWIRRKIYFLTLDDNGDLEKIEPFMPEQEFNNPMDIEYGPDGKMYMLEYGTGWFTQNVDARLVRIDYQAGNRGPVVNIGADRTNGGVPLTVQFNSDGSEDFDGDALSYLWEFHKGASSTDSNPEFTFQAAGIYEVKLTITDENGASTTESIEIQAGNEVPAIDIAVAGNQTFFWDGRMMDYEVKVNDREDGSISDGGINSQDVRVTLEYLEQASKETILGHMVDDEAEHQITGATLIADSDCKACHAPEKRSIGPSYVEIANKYKGRNRAVATLSNKVINGGSGVWGETPMAAHPSISLADAKMMVEYILSFGEESGITSLPIKGSIATSTPAGKENTGVYILKASYTDRGGEVAGPSTGQASLALRSAEVRAADFDSKDGDVQLMKIEDNEIIILNGKSVLSYLGIDMTGVKSLMLEGATQGESGTTFELRLGSAEGQLIASSELKSTGTEVQPGIYRSRANLEFDPLVGPQDLYLISTGTEDGGFGGSLTKLNFKLD